MTTSRSDWTRFLYLERQFCSICRAQGTSGVRVADVRDRLTMTGSTWRRRRNAQAKRHMMATHPELTGLVR
jgi:hypothetical protein